MGWIGSGSGLDVCVSGSECGQFHSVQCPPGQWASLDALQRAQPGQHTRGEHIAIGDRVLATWRWRPIALWVAIRWPSRWSSRWPSRWPSHIGPHRWRRCCGRCGRCGFRRHRGLGRWMIHDGKRRANGRWRQRGWQRRRRQLGRIRWQVRQGVAGLNDSSVPSRPSGGGGGGRWVGRQDRRCLDGGKVRFQQRHRGSGATAPPGGHCIGALGGRKRFSGTVEAIVGAIVRDIVRRRRRSQRCPQCRQAP